MASASGYDPFQQRHIHHSFVLLLPLTPPTRHGVCDTHRPSRIDSKGGNSHTRPTAFEPYHIPCLKLFHQSHSHHGEAISHSPWSMPPHALHKRYSVSPFEDHCPGMSGVYPSWGDVVVSVLTPNVCAGVHAPPRQRLQACMLRLPEPPLRAYLGRTAVPGRQARRGGMSA